MKVWIFQTGEPLHVDEGAARPMRAMNLANSLLSAGHQVILWSSAFYHQEKFHRADHYTIFQLADGFEIRLIPSIGYEKNVGISRLIDHAHLAFKFYKTLKFQTSFPDVVVIGYPPIETSVILNSWCKKRRIPTLLDVKDLWPAMFLDVWPRLLRPVARMVLSPYAYCAKKSMRDAIGISATSDAFLTWILKYAHREKTLWDAVFPLTSPSLDLPESEIHYARRWWKDVGVCQDNQMCRILFVGSFMSIYDFKPIQHAAQLFAKENISVQFVLCGSGGSFNEIKKLFEGLPNVIFPGWVDRPKIITLADMSHAALAPYLNIDNFKVNITNKVIDAMSLGLPILCPLQGEVANLIVKYHVGLRYGTDTGKTLYDCIRALMEDRKSQQEMSKNGKVLYQKFFSFDKVYGSLVTHLEKMAVVDPE